MTPAAGGVRLTWAELPADLRGWVEDVLGGPVVSATSQAGGFSPGTADRVVTRDGRRAFVKAVGTAQNQESPGIHRREGVIAAGLPESPHLPRLVDRRDDGDWMTLVFDDIEGRTPQVPWRTDELEATLVALDVLADLLTPSPVVDLTAVPERWRSLFAGWSNLRERPDRSLDPWARQHLDALVDLAERGRLALVGDTLVHGDLRADNLLVRPDGIVAVVDWPWASPGADWLDRALLMINVDLHGGHDVDALLARSTPAARAGDITAVLAGVCGYFHDAAREPPPVGLPTVRGFQRDQARSTLAWLRRRLDR